MEGEPKVNQQFTEDVKKQTSETVDSANLERETIETISELKGMLKWNSKKKRYEKTPSFNAEKAKEFFRGIQDLKKWVKLTKNLRREIYDLQGVFIGFWNNSPEAN